MSLCFRISVRTTIYFDYQFILVTHEIYDKASYRFLPTKLSA